MGEVDGSRQQFDQGGGLRARPRRRVEQGGQAAAGAEFQGHVRTTDAAADRAFPNLEHLHDVRMLKPRDRFRFAAEALAVLLAGRRTRQDHFERHQPIQPRLTGLVNDGHAASTDFAQDLIARHFRPRRGVLRRPRRFGERFALKCLHDLGIVVGERLRGRS